jgi:hypothetical protein
MVIFDNILDIVLPDYLTHMVSKLTSQFASLSFLSLVLDLCMKDFNPRVGRTGKGGIYQVQMSHHSLVPQEAVIAQSRMLFFVFDQNLSRPAFQMVGHG